MITGNTDTTFSANKKPEGVQYIEIDSGVEKMKVPANDSSTLGNNLSLFVTYFVKRFKRF